MLPSTRINAASPGPALLPIPKPSFHRTAQGARPSPPAYRNVSLSIGLDQTASISGRGQLGLAPRLGAQKQPSHVVRVFEAFTERSIKAVMIAQASSNTYGAAEVGTEHLLLGLVDEETSSAKNGFYLSTSLTLEKAQRGVELMFGRRGTSAAVVGQVPFGKEVRRTFETAATECKRQGINFIAPEHILLAMLSIHEAGARRVLDSLGVDCQALKKEAVKRLRGDQDVEIPQRKRVGDKEGAKILAEYTRDLCAHFKAGRIDPVIGRTKEVLRVCQILGRRTKNNPILLGEPGVGKTAIAEGLAAAIVNRVQPDGSPLPMFLEGKRVLALDVALLVAGAKERGELENRATKLIAEVQDSGDIILMIDEVHMLVGAGSSHRSGGSGGGLDIANLLKPALARGQLQVIGATTVDEHRKYIEKDAALERRFQPVHVGEPDAESSLAILHGLRERYERHHRCAYSDEALQAAVALSTRYIADRFLPDKAIDLMDEAGSRARIVAYTARKVRPPGSCRNEHPKVHEYMQVMETKEEAVKDQLFEEAGTLRRREIEYRAELAGIAEEGSSLPLVDVADIEAVVASWTGIPVQQLAVAEKTKLMDLGRQLQERVVGQEGAVRCVAQALRRSRCGLGDPNRPVASLLFVGPTGVGKTELTRVLAELYFGSRDAMIRLDMSEYMEKHSVSKLVGAPPGFLGYGEGGKLTEAVRRRPNSIVLFDEVEKAHPDVFNLLLQVMEDGRLSDSQGRVVSFKQTLIILTSNIGSRAIAAAGSSGTLSSRVAAAVAARARTSAMSTTHSGSGHIGSGGGGSSLADFDAVTGVSSRQMIDEETQRQRGRMESMVLAEAKAFFRPELLNRFDEQVVFHQLNRANVAQIAQLMLADTRTRVSRLGYGLEVGPALMQRIFDDGYSPEYGARPLRQAIIRYVDDPIAEALLGSSIAKESQLFVDLHPMTGDVMVTINGMEVSTGLSPVHSKSAHASDGDAAEEAEGGRFSGTLGGGGSNHGLTADAHELKSVGRQPLLVSAVMGADPDAGASIM